ncbi:MAG: FAD-binding oxidoreductase [Candidatus Saccharimonadia bacterium]
MKNFLEELQRDLAGSVTDESSVLKYYANDAGIFSVEPTGVVYPFNTQDIITTVKFVAERAASGKQLSITPRGKGTDLGGGAIGSGLILSFPSHMNRMLKLEKHSVTVQPGINYTTLQRILQSHGRYLPPYPSSQDVSTIGGAVANNAAGEKSLKYGSTRNFVRALSIVLSDGSIIETRRLNGRELSRKKGLSTFEGEIYRKIDALIDQKREIIRSARPKVTKNTSGYAIWDVKTKDGSFDLGQLIIGSQGSLGLLSSISLKTEQYNAKTTLVLGYFDSIRNATEAIIKLKRLNPSVMESINDDLLKFVSSEYPGIYDNVISAPFPKIVLIVEFDDFSQIRQVVKARQTLKIMKSHGSDAKISTKVREQQAIWRMRRNSASIIWQAKSKHLAIPIIEDAIVPLPMIPEFLDCLSKLLHKYNIESGIWGHAGDGHFHLLPLIDVGVQKNREAALKLANDFYALVAKLGGSFAGEHNDGILRTPYLDKLYSPAMINIFREIKTIFDPHNIFNPGKKVDTTVAQMHELFVKDYRSANLSHIYDHLPIN